MTALATTAQPFDFRGQPVRVVMIDGAPWFVGKDVASALGYARPRDAVADHVPAGHKRGADSALPFDLALDPQTVLIDEAGMYRLVMRSRTEAAEAFQEWVTADVLPSLRQNGIAVRADLDPLDVAQQMLTVLLAQREETRALAAEQDRLRWSQRALTARVLDVETRQAAIESRHDWFVALAYAKREGHPTARQYLAKVGAKASVIGRAAGLPDVYTQDDRHGQVRSWPSWVWDQAFSEVAA